MNQVFFNGHLGQDIEVVALEKGAVEGVLKVASNEWIAGQKFTTWATAVIQDNRALTLQDELYKGRFVVIRGALRSKNFWIEAEQKSIPMMFIHVIEIQFDPKSSVNRGQTNNQNSQ